MRKVLGIRKCGIEPQESTRIFSSISPTKKPESATVLLCALTSDFTGGCPPPPSRSLCQRVNLGVAVLDSLGVGTFKVLTNDPEVYDGVTDTEKYVWMSEGFIDTAKSTSSDGSMMIATAPYSLAPGDSLISTWAFIGANNLSDLLTSAARAKTKANLFKRSE